MTSNPATANFNLYRNPDIVLDSFKVLCTKAHIYIIGHSLDNSYYRLLIVDRHAPIPTTPSLQQQFQPGMIDLQQQSSNMSTNDNYSIFSAKPMSITSVGDYEATPKFSATGNPSHNTPYGNNRRDIVTDDGLKYTLSEVDNRVTQHAAEHRSSGGALKVVVEKAYGLTGFIRFTRGFYISIITGRRAVALLGGKYIYHIEDTILLSVSPRAEKSRQEARMLTLFRNVDLTKNFYFSYTYDITNTLQNNMKYPGSFPGTDKEQDMTSKLRAPKGSNQPAPLNSMFVWNHHMISNGCQILGVRPEWMVPLIHGYVDQSKLATRARDIYITLIARRSRIYAGVRFLKRGVNNEGFVANEVETEQIVNTMEIDSFDAPYGIPNSNPYYTSYVQHRGSIPLNWSQETSTMAPKPPIEITVSDPYFVQASRHFHQMFDRYGLPTIVLNLIKTKERYKRESILGDEFSECIQYLNQFLSKHKNLRYIGWDMSKANKNKAYDVIKILEEIAEEALVITGIFHSGPEPYYNYLQRLANPEESNKTYRQARRLQNGIVRSNCIDCLDRTNAAQTIIGKTALAHQLYELGVIDKPYLSFDTDASNIMEEMFHDLGDTIALQYGGSNLVNTMQTYRKINNWSSHSRDMIEAFRRYYSNSFVDAERQEGIDMFLGIIRKDHTLPTRNLDIRPSQHLMELVINGSKDYCGDCSGSEVSTIENLINHLRIGDHTNVDSSIDLGSSRLTVQPNNVLLDIADNIVSPSRELYWHEYYTPGEYTEFENFFPMIMNSTTRYRSTTTSPNSATNSASISSNQNFINSGANSPKRDTKETISTTRIVHSKADTPNAHHYEYNEDVKINVEDKTAIGNPFAERNENTCNGGSTNLASAPTPTAVSAPNNVKTHGHKIRKKPKWLKPPSNRQNKFIPDEIRIPTKEQILSKIENRNNLSPNQLGYEGHSSLSSDSLSGKLGKNSAYNVGGWYTDGVTRTLQEPKVSKKDLEGYKKYINQFDDLSSWITDPNYRRGEIAHKDQDNFWTNSVRPTRNYDDIITKPRYNDYYEQKPYQRQLGQGRMKRFLTFSGERPSDIFYRGQAGTPKFASQDQRFDGHVDTGSIRDDGREGDSRDIRSTIFSKQYAEEVEVEDEEDNVWIEEPTVKPNDLAIYQAFSAMNVCPNSQIKGIDRPRRVIEYKDKVYHTVFEEHMIPTQWQAWLHHTRYEPPTVQELELDIIRRMKLQENVKKLVAVYDKVDKEEVFSRKSNDQAQLIEKMPKVQKLPQRDREAEKESAPAETHGK
ncbi:phosphatidylinositol-3,5-bisphosphate 5-phosphatase [Mycoemilia scoparia]|uniref:Phosphatidylinositol-3,5-bisphosphate 5-phosphatase n=1 Tax=Mycoemilia scoparia TaxID=417184 RepID=A0A9W8DV68_9FUNG|nr:phosphatidylinositol-3,5-bisphosphate 5-phosphatase [Mycoemilia scoparia]